MPLSAYLKHYFSLNKKHGSRDRKLITQLCFSYYRLGKSLDKIPVHERITVGMFLTVENIFYWKLLFEESWQNYTVKGLQERNAFIQSVYPAYVVENIFPEFSAFSEGIEHFDLSISMLKQPKVFIRIRPEKKAIVENKLHATGISYELLSEKAIALKENIHIENVLAINSTCVIQDLNSQNIESFLMNIHKDNSGNKPMRIWDCCAGSGGKSILAYDTIQNIKLTVSDIRPSIIINLKKRFFQAEITNYNSLIVDLDSDNSLKQLRQKFDLIICDAPCTGSGTWSRTPEQLYFFKKENVDKYVELQKRIIRKTIPFLEKNGHFLYITCSVFAKENEAISSLIEKEFSLKLIRKELLTGYHSKADTLYAALFTA